jgi:triacylglycerol lipase
MDMDCARLALVACTALLLGASSAASQGPGVPPEIAHRLREIGRVSAPNETRPLYAPLQEKQPYAGIRVVRNERYGNDSRNRLDVFMPENARSESRPVLLFVHGGAYVGGDKAAPGSPFYSNVGVWAARHGMVGVNMNYRLAPRYPWPAAEEDIAGALRWVYDNIATRGGDPARIFLMGHSAGATHVATYLANTDLNDPRSVNLAGAILVSAYYDLTRIKPTGSFQKYFGNDPARYAERSALPGLLKSKLPMLFAVAEFDTPTFNAQADILRKAFCGHGQCPHLIVLPQHSHMSEIYSINTADTGLSDQIAAFVKAHQ